MKGFLQVAGILVAMAGVVLAIAGADAKRADANPMAGVALGVCAIALLQAAKES